MVIASFVTIVDLVMKAYFPTVYSFLGVWIPLIVVNCIVLGRAEAFAYHNSVCGSRSPTASAWGSATLIVITVLAAVPRAVRHRASSRSSARRSSASARATAAPDILLLFPGAFILFGFMIAGSQALNRYLTARKEAV